MRIDEFAFDLPDSAIARHPASERDLSRLMHLDRAMGTRAHHRFRNLPDLLRPGDLLVVNRSRVLPARLVGTRPGGGSAELLLVRQTAPNEWLAMVRPGRKLRAGTRVAFAEGLFATVLSPAAEGPSALRRVALGSDGAPVPELLERVGRIPLPPYLGRSDGPQDRIRYQTVYARESGSIAAPTAGLHFTSELLAAMKDRGIETAQLVLHVGPGTFRPVEAADVREHVVDPEAYEIPEAAAKAIADAKREGRRIVAVGTTVVRTLEGSAAENGIPVAGEGETGLVIVPGFRFSVVDALVTNFHLPRSSLLLLVCAFAGKERTLRAYAEAIRDGYRFYSYGDAMLIT